ncbi:MAG: acylphosphatase [Candidatus Colwellbacteria bacterium]|nr:acylphosphatase [Candidatus Colwellbacteria bacterium]
MKHLNIKIYGRVQGVFFRDSVKRKAEEWGIKGFARNEADGPVYIEAEGPEAAKVDKVEIEEGDLVNFQNFQIK